ncbi:MAG: glycine zipper domain-containing protein [Alphaproteobacteria bacterium]
MKKLFSLLILPLSMFLSSCADNIGANSYESSAAGQVNSAQIGTVISVRQVNVATSNGTVGSLAGGLAGGAAGSMVSGKGPVSMIGAVGGALLGGMAGSAAQEKMSSQTGYEYIVKLDSGSVVTITQGADNILAVGQRCAVLNAHSGERARVIPY